jgi:hypothetical protein
VGPSHSRAAGSELLACSHSSVATYPSRKSLTLCEAPFKELAMEQGHVPSSCSHGAPSCSPCDPVRTVRPQFITTQLAVAGKQRSRSVLPFALDFPTSLQ